MKALLDYYAEILEHIERSNLRVRNKENKKLACYFYSKGDLYDNKLMVIGRAGNGGNELNAWNQGDSVNKNIKEYIYSRYTDSMAWKLSWVTNWWGRRGVENGEKLYNSATPFWQLVKEVLRGITEKNKWDENNWSQKIVWSNIYKFSPMNGGNPNYTLQILQMEGCKKILKWEIEKHKPQNILFVTGDNWFNDVKDIFIFLDDQWVYKYDNENYANIYICGRPEFKSPYEMAQGILAKLK